MIRVPSWKTSLGSLLTVLVIAFLVKLGLWQLDRGVEKQALFDDFAAAQRQQQDWLTLPSAQSLSRYQPVQARGHFVQPVLLLDNQVQHGRVGYHVLALLALEASSREPAPPLLAVNLGWLAADRDRRQLPSIQLPEGVVTVQGWAYPSQQATHLSDAELLEAASQPYRIQAFDSQRLSSLLDLPIAPTQVLLSESAPFGYSRTWQPNVMPPEKHRAYALTWFSLALAALIIALLVARSTRTRTEE